MLHPDHQGHGYATEAAEASVELAFGTYRLHRVYGCVEPRNTGSARVLERLGMRKEAHLIENEWGKGEWQSEAIYAILAREWRAARECRRTGSRAAPGCMPSPRTVRSRGTPQPRYEHASHHQRVPAGANVRTRRRRTGHQISRTAGATPRGADAVAPAPAVRVGASGPHAA